MLKTAIKWGKSLYYCLIISAVFFGSSSISFGSQYQQCPANSNCTIGEFLYDDNYSPISIGTSCTLTSRYPNGDVLVNAENMVGTADGWYSYSVGTSGLSNGVYRGQMCCNTSGENICLDKTFEVAATLSTLVDDIWASPNRSLTDFGSLVSNIWSHSSAVGTSTALNSIGTSLANLSVQVSNVDTKVITIDAKVDSLSSAVSTISTNTSNILTKWSSYSVSDIINYIDTLETQLGTNSQVCADDTVFGQIQCIQDKWGSESASTLYTAASNAYSTSVLLRSELNFAGKSTTAYDEIITLKNYVDTLETSVGTSSDLSSASTVFGRIQQVKEAVDAIDSTTLDLTDLLNKWGSYTATDIYDKVKNLSSDISALNTVTNVSSIINTTTTTTNIFDIKNQVLAMRALLDVNRQQLEVITNRPIIKSWLEEGSIIFKSLITNPSSVTQDVDFVYYLPQEVSESDIMKKSDNLTIKYDPSKSSLYASGQYKLKPKETLIVEVEVNDIWSVSSEKIESLRRLATELFTPLKKTSYFAQGVTLHSDIQASLDKIIEIQKSSSLPEDKIRDSRIAQIELESVNKKMDSLKEIVAQSGSINTLSGFIGGVQTVGVWGIIIVLIAGFILLAVYIKSINSKSAPSQKSSSDPIIPTRAGHRPKKGIFFALVLGSMFGVSSSGTYYFMSRQSSKSNIEPAVLSATTDTLITPTFSPTLVPVPTIADELDEIVIDEPIISVSPTVTITPTIIPTKTPFIASSQKQAIVVPSLNSYVNVRVSGSKTATQISRILSGSEVIVLSESVNADGEKWTEISQGAIRGWVFGQFIQYLSSTSSLSPSAKVTISVPPRDTVYIYSKPSFSASIAQKITESQSAEILLETKMWAKIVLTRQNIQGWVSQDFISKNN